MTTSSSNTEAERVPSDGDPGGQALKLSPPTNHSRVIPARQEVGDPPKSRKERLRELWRSFRDKLRQSIKRLQDQYQSV